MKILWCWRCKKDVPMLEDDEWILLDKILHDKKRHSDPRPLMLAEFERLTGYTETCFNALFHHVISGHGPPCPQCGKVLRTQVAYKCFECGLKIHEPGWSFLCRLTHETSFIRKSRITIRCDASVAQRISRGCKLEFRSETLVLGRATVRTIKAPGNASDATTLAEVSLDASIPFVEVPASFELWLSKPSNA